MRTARLTPGGAHFAFSGSGEKRYLLRGARVVPDLHFLRRVVTELRVGFSGREACDGVLRSPSISWISKLLSGRQRWQTFAGTPSPYVPFVQSHLSKPRRPVVHVPVLRLLRTIFDHTDTDAVAPEACNYASLCRVSTETGFHPFPR